MALFFLSSKRWLPSLVVLWSSFFWGSALAQEDVTYSLQVLAYAPNAGGQTAYSLRRGDASHEITAFANTYIQAGGLPLLGGSYAWRQALCDDRCFVQFYVQVGAGISSAGPLLDFTWSSIWLWLGRLDVSTHVMFGRRRPITWSYPIWIGIALPF